MKNTEALIITIGDELLIGQVVDTNSAWIAKRLNEIGITIKKRIAIGDVAGEIWNALETSNKESDVVLITGGLGPTSDDITKEILCRFFSGNMVVNQGALDNVVYLFEKIYHKPVSEVNLKQAEVPDVCEVIQNKRGSAPGMVFEKGKTLFISMPGVPYEMEGIMEEVIPLLSSRFRLPEIIHQTLLTAGIGESAIAEKLTDFERDLPGDIRLAYLPSYGMVRLRLSTSGFEREVAQRSIHFQFEKMKQLVKGFMVTDKDESMQEVLGHLLRETGRSVATAESCTGGAIASLITSVPGSSDYFAGSIVSYANPIKENLLGVNKVTLEKYGAVSAETVSEMLTGLLKRMGTDFGIAVSGIMGPGGGTFEKPVGTVWIAVGNTTEQVVTKLQQRFGRLKNIEVTSVMALNLLRKFILEKAETTFESVDS